MCALRLTRVVGLNIMVYHAISTRARFPALISVGGAYRFLEDLSPDVPRNNFFGKVAEAKVVQHVKLG